MRPAVHRDQSTEGTILVVEDDPSVAKATARLLRVMAFQVLIATTPEEAIEICRAHATEIDLVLLDLMLQEKTSIDTLVQIRSFHSGIKVILTSGYTKDESITSLAGIRLEGFLQKPFGFSELEHSIRSVLS